MMEPILLVELVISNLELMKYYDVRGQEIKIL